jgi:hypothetical protein
MRLSALSARRPLPSGRFLVLISECAYVGDTTTLPLKRVEKTTRGTVWAVLCVVRETDGGHN